MGYDHFFRFIKDDLIDSNIAFMQNVDNFLFCLYFGYLDRYESDIKKERNRLLDNLFSIIKNSLMCKYYDLDGKYILDKLIDLKYNHKKINYAEMEVDLILYCILVNGLDKTKGKKFDKIKKEIEPLTKILKEMFCEFDKNEIHKERTFIFALRSPAGTHDDYYIINYKDDLLRKSFDDNYNFYDDVNDDNDDDDNDDDNDNYNVYDDDIKSMFLHKSSNKDEKDERKFKYYSIVLDESLYGDEKEYKL